MKYVCTVCGWVYDEDEGNEEMSIAAGTEFEELDDSFACPICGVDKDHFEKEE